MNKALTLSIVIPAYNEESHIDACLQSIAAQTVMPKEVLVVDNNSSDNTKAIAAKYDFVRILDEKRQGVVFARDTGFDEASTDIIGRIDADTLLTPEWVENVLAVFESKDVDAITGPVGYYDMPLEMVGKTFDHLIRQNLSRSKKFKFLFGTNMAIRKPAWQQVRETVCRDSDLHEDLDLAIHLDEAGCMITYERTIPARMSARRLDDRPYDFYKYIKMWDTTYDRHEMETFAPKVAMNIYLTTYFLIKPLRYFYDEEAQRINLRAVKKGIKRKARKNPMADSDS